MDLYLQFLLKFTTGNARELERTHRQVEDHEVGIQDGMLAQMQDPTGYQAHEPREEVLREGVEKAGPPGGHGGQPETQPDLLAGFALGLILHQ
jgi:hypothetical protein